MNPVCLFPTRKQCDDVNADMLSRLDTEMHEIGTVQAISARCISVKFDHISDPLDIEKVKGKFMVSKVFADTGTMVDPSSRDTS